MKLSLEQHDELNKMALYFDRIEEIAERMGVEVDTLVEEIKENHNAVYFKLKKNLMAIESSRQHIFRMHENRSGQDENSIINLHVIVNEDRL